MLGKKGGFKMSDKSELSPQFKISSSPSPSKRKWLVLFLIVTVLVVAVGYFSGLFTIVSKVPHEEMIAAMKKTNKLETKEVYANIRFSILSDDPQVELINQLITNLCIDMYLKSDRKDHCYQIDYNLMYKNDNCGNLVLYLDKEKITAQSQLLGNKALYFEWKDIEELAKKHLDIQVQINDYLPLLVETDRRSIRKLENTFYDIYEDLYSNKITRSKEKVNLTVIEDDKEKTIACKELILKLDSFDNSIEENLQFLQSILENEIFRALIKEKIAQFINIAKNNGDLDTWPLTEEKIIDFSANLDTQLDLVIASMIEKFEQMEVKKPTVSQVGKGKVRIDKQGFWRNMVMEQTILISDPEIAEPPIINTIMELNLISPHKELAFTEINFGEAIDVGKLPEAGWEVLQQEIAMNLLGQVFLNPLFRDIVRISTIINNG